MKKPKLSPLELEHKRARDQLRYLSNRLRGAYSFGHIKTFSDLLSAWGLSDKQMHSMGYFPNELSRGIGMSDINEWISDRGIELETSIWLINNPIKYNDDESESISNRIPTVSESIPQIHGEEDARIEVQERTNNSTTDELPPSEKEKAFLFWFQKKTVIQMLRDTTKYFEWYESHKTKS